MAIGALLGAFNGLFIAGFGLPTLIVTLGTLSIFRGFLLTFVGSEADLEPAAGDAQLLAADDGARHQRRRLVLLAALGLRLPRRRRRA